MPADPVPLDLDLLRDLHRRAVEETSSGRPAAAARLLRAGLRQLGRRRGDAPALTARFLGSLAVAEVYMGHSGPAFALLDEADGLVPPEDRGILVQQRGLLLFAPG